MSELSRSIGVRGLTASLFNMTVGGGIFAMPAVVAQMLGPSALYAYVACALAMLCIVLAFAVAGSRVPRAGGTAAYADAAFGPSVGFAAAALNWLSDTLAAAAVMAGLTAAIAASVPSLGSPIARGCVLAAILSVFAAINMRGVRQGTRVVEVMTVAKLTPLLVLVVAAAATTGGDMWQMGPLPDAGTIGRATLVLIFAFSGPESVMELTGEVARPVRTIPMALVLALALVTTLYVLVHLAAGAALGVALPGTPDATLAAAAAVLLGSEGRALLLVGTIVSMAGFASAAVMTTPRLVYAVARRRLLPAWLGHVHPVWQTPARAIACQSAVFFVLASSGSFGAIAGFASVAVVSVYLLACASAWHLQRRDWRARPGPDDDAPTVAEPRPIRVPSAVLAAGAVFCVALLAQATFRELLVVVCVLAAASGWALVAPFRSGQP